MASPKLIAKLAKVTRSRYLSTPQRAHDKADRANVSVAPSKSRVTSPPNEPPVT
jgi:hypothetical protein